jgi:hypothetical protein
LSAAGCGSSAGSGTKPHIDPMAVGVCNPGRALFGDSPSLGLGTSYYVSPSGDDSNSGTSESTAWKTLRMFSAITLAPGDNLLLEGGQTFDGTIRPLTPAAMAGAPAISITSYGAGRATINEGRSAAISILSASNVQIWNLELRGGWDAVEQDGNTSAGLNLSNATRSTQLERIVIDRVESSGFRDAGIRLTGSTSKVGKFGFTDVTISNSCVHDNGQAGIEVGGSFDMNSKTYSHRNVTVRGCEVFQNRGLYDANGHTGNGILLEDVDGALVELNVSHANGDLNTNKGGGPVGIWAWDSNAVTIQLNESYGNRSQTGDGGGFDLDGGMTNSVAQYNYSHDNDGPGYLIAQFPYARPMGNNVIRYNISQNDCRNHCGALTVWNGDPPDKVTGTLVYNNTFYATRSSDGEANYAVWFIEDKPAPNTKLYNNLFVTSGPAVIVSTPFEEPGIEVLSNNYWSVGAPANSPTLISWEGKTFRDLSSFRAATGQEQRAGGDVGMNGDPALVNMGGGPTLGDASLLSSVGQYQLTPASSLVDSALDLKVEFAIDPGAHDYYGTPIFSGAAPDIGACELKK